MQTMSPLEEHSRVPMHLSLGEPAIYLETTGYVAWADALGRAGVRFSDLPEESRMRLREWLTSHDSDAELEGAAVGGARATCLSQRKPK